MGQRPWSGRPGTIYLCARYQIKIVLFRQLKEGILNFQSLIGSLCTEFKLAFSGELFVECEADPAVHLHLIAKIREDLASAIWEECYHLNCMPS